MVRNERRDPFDRLRAARALVDLGDARGTAEISSFAALPAHEVPWAAATAVGRLTALVARLGSASWPSRILSVVDTKMTKSAGEHWVCSVLASAGWGAALTRDGLERTDILAVRADGTRRMIEVQVKAASPMPQPNWRCGTKTQLPSLSDREWFVFVALDPMPGQAPASYVVPRDHVWAAAWMEHQAWLTEPGVPPGKRNTGFDQARVYASTWEGYRNAWDLLEQPTSQCPVRLPQAWRAWVDDPRVGLPPGHPWGDVLPDWQAVEGS
ncbi:hypothetical protein ACFV4T_12255 [Streptomyces sp. NPDC059755]|uniref:hypothetical protein n=1 Tax=Streptomyces sp. NPDC059755 TaxID=3346934 RepID=UPI00364CC418